MNNECLNICVILHGFGFFLLLIFITSIIYMQSTVNINNTMLSSIFDIHLQINNYSAYIIR